MNLTSSIHFGAKVGWHKGILNLNDDTLTLKDENGNTVFEYKLSDITKVVNRRTIWLGIYTNDRKSGWSISFGNMYAYAGSMGAGGAVGTLAADSMDRKAQTSMQDWLDFFQSQDLLVKGFNIYKYRQVVFLVTLIILVILLIAGLSRH
jgi:hypothetical protein